jgi:hypothetical protein
LTTIISSAGAIEIRLGRQLQLTDSVDLQRSSSEYYTRVFDVLFVLGYV